jgi:hypothetical protein
MYSVAESARISFAEAPDGSIFFTSAKGDLRRKVHSGRTQILQTPQDGVFVDVVVDPTGRKVAVEFVDERSSAMPSIIVFDFDSATGLKERRRVNGSMPRFSKDGALFFLLPKRFVPQIGFGGNFWVDFQIMHFKDDGQDPQLVGDREFFIVSDFAPHDAMSFYVSGTKEDMNEDVVESIVVYQPGEKDVDKIIECQQAHVCSSQPDISIDGTKVVFVSDKYKEFFYWLYEANIETGGVALIKGGDSFRYVQSPVYSRKNPGSVIALCANDFSTDGQPQFSVVRFMESNTEVIVTNEELYGREPTAEK